MGWVDRICLMVGRKATREPQPRPDSNQLQAAPNIYISDATLWRWRLKTRVVFLFEVERLNGGTTQRLSFGRGPEISVIAISSHEMMGKPVFLTWPSTTPALAGYRAIHTREIGGVYDRTCYSVSFKKKWRAILSFQVHTLLIEYEQSQLSREKTD
jgi:hypothetical protein